MVCLTVTYIAIAGREEEMEGIFRQLIGPSRAEPGCKMYLVHRSRGIPSKFFLYEQYVDDAALDAHRNSAHFLKYAEMAFAISESRERDVLDPLE